jgi:hypothetical protein
MIIRAWALAPPPPPAAQGLQGFPFAAHGLHGLAFLAAHGLHGFAAFFAAHGLQGFPFAAHGLHGLAFLAAQGLQGLAAPAVSVKAKAPLNTKANVSKAIPVNFQHRSLIEPPSLLGKT